MTMKNLFPCWTVDIYANSYFYWHHVVKETEAELKSVSATEYYNKYYASNVSAFCVFSRVKLLISLNLSYNAWKSTVSSLQRRKIHVP